MNGVMILHTETDDTLESSGKAKVFKDPVHGYISVDEDIVDRIIDCMYFQRLRRIEQSSMRCVYPSARHDRFAHSPWLLANLL